MKCHGEEYGVTPPDGYIVGERLPSIDDEPCPDIYTGDTVICINAPIGSGWLFFGSVYVIEGVDELGLSIDGHGRLDESRFAPLIKDEQAEAEPRPGQSGKTRDGLSVRVVCADMDNREYPIAIAVLLRSGGEWAFQYTGDLRCFHEGRESENDIVELDGKPWPRVRPVDKEQMRRNAGLLRGGVTV